MNIFFLDSDPKKNAQYHVDRHVVKMIVESLQLLSAAFPPGVAPYKVTHANHPCAIWVRESRSNYNELVEIAEALCAEYTHRYGKTHKCESLLPWFKGAASMLVDKGSTTKPRAFGEFKNVIPETGCVYSDYRNYYIMAKGHLANYKNRNKPDWFVTH